MRKTIFILLLLATVAVASRYFRPVDQFGSDTMTQPTGDFPNAGDEAKSAISSSDLPAVRVDVAEWPVADIEDAVYEDFSEVEGATIYELYPGSSIVRSITDDGVTYPGSIRVTKGSVAVENARILAGLFVLDMRSFVLASEMDLFAKIREGLEVQTHPTASFIIQDIDSDTVSGIWKLKGVSKKITFPALVTIDERKIRIVSDFSIDQTQWGIVPVEPTVSRYADVHIERILKRQ